MDTAYDKIRATFGVTIIRHYVNFSYEITRDLQ